MRRDGGSRWSTSERLSGRPTPVRRRAGSGVAVDYDQMTVEHVASQNPGSGATQVSVEHVAAIGNQLFCDQRIQEKLKNKAFAEKRKILRGSGLAAAKDMVAKRRWDEEAID